MKIFLLNLCRGMRVDETAPDSFTVYPPSQEKASEVSRELCDTGKVQTGRDGHEYLRSLGIVQLVRAFRFEDCHVRIVSPAQTPSGQFSNLRSLERTVTAPVPDYDFA